MARTKSVSGNRRTRQARSIVSDSTVGEIKQRLGGYNYKNLARKVRANPFLLNAGIGVGAFFLVRSAIRYYKAHPAIAEFLKENLDTVEAKFREYRGSDDETLSDARH